jgi:Cytochrome C oxidase, cbb3-type, subunit III
MRYIMMITRIFILMLLSQIALANDNSEYYQAKDGKVDAATFIGWSTYHSVCVGCHGVGAVGSEIAPDLTEIADRLSPEQFRLKVMHRTIVKFTTDDWLNMEESMYKEIAKQEIRDKGVLETMPRWKYNPMVTRNVTNIYRYLKARAANAIGPKKPGVLK